MSLRIGDDAPNFKAQTTLGEIDFHQWLGNTWGIIYSHPADFTPVCTTELGRTAQLKDEFAKRDTKVIAVSIDGLEDHKKWINDINETQNTKVEFPIIADTDKNVATLYNMIHPNFSTTATVRSVYFISPEKKIQAIITYPASTGRSFTEILRVLDSLQLTAGHSVATPVDWEVGQDVIISPSVKQEDVEASFPKGHRVIKPYLRYTPQPNK
ncbi:peroxiredoxin [Mariniflexile ostreae]|uniref:Peroxiredoxin n=1 Tax=Mariniflexile ostreae TaxID=1520892 RepID=A0ABV5FBB7_9FLAO